MMKTILFIYGYGGSPKSRFCTLIREALPDDEYQVLCPEYPQADCGRTREFFHHYLAEHPVDLIIGTSLGGFNALALGVQIPTLVLNPCMVPSEVLPRLQPRADHPDDVAPSEEMIASYKPFEPLVFDPEAHGKVVGLFAEQDELLGTKYKQRFRDSYGEAGTMPGGHHGNEEAIPTIITTIHKMLGKRRIAHHPTSERVVSVHAYRIN